MARCYDCIVRSSFFWALALMVVLQPYASGAALIAQPAAVPPLTAAPMRVVDVALKRGGVLQGQIVNEAGAGIAEVPVKLTAGRQHWQTKTDAQGWFRVAGLRGGTYQFLAVEQVQLLRAWAAGTAPPSASQGVLVTPSTDIVRAQRVISPKTNRFFRVAKQQLANPWVFGGIVATAVAIPVAIHNADDDDPPATP